MSEDMQREQVRKILMDRGYVVGKDGALCTATGARVMATMKIGGRVWLPTQLAEILLNAPRTKSIGQPRAAGERTEDSAPDEF
jgi:cytochrome oxidase assembly protein ShyY1